MTGRIRGRRGVTGSVSSVKISVPLVRGVQHILSPSPAVEHPTHIPLSSSGNTIITVFRSQDTTSRLKWNYRHHTKRKTMPQANQTLTPHPLPLPRLQPQTSFNTTPPHSRPNQDPPLPRFQLFASFPACMREISGSRVLAHILTCVNHNSRVHLPPRSTVKQNQAQGGGRGGIDEIDKRSGAKGIFFATRHTYLAPDRLQTRHRIRITVSDAPRCQTRPGERGEARVGLGQDRAGGGGGRGRVWGWD